MENIYECKNCQKVTGFYLGMTCPKCNKPFRSIIHNPKQETVEEAAEREYPKEGEESIYCDLGLIQQDAFKHGYKLAKEKSYSDEEVLNILDIILSEYKYSLRTKTDFHPALMFEQFKKNKSWKQT